MKFKHRAPSRGQHYRAVCLKTVCFPTLTYVDSFIVSFPVGRVVLLTPYHSLKLMQWFQHPLRSTFKKMFAWLEITVTGRHTTDVRNHTWRLKSSAPCKTAGLLCVPCKRMMHVSKSVLLTQLIKIVKCCFAVTVIVRSGAKGFLESCV